MWYACFRVTERHSVRHRQISPCKSANLWLSVCPIANKFHSRSKTFRSNFKTDKNDVILHYIAKNYMISKINFVISQIRICDIIKYTCDVTKYFYDVTNYMYNFDEIGFRDITNSISRNKKKIWTNAWYCKLDICDIKIVFYNITQWYFNITYSNSGLFLVSKI